MDGQMEALMQVHLLCGVVERILHMLTTDAFTVIRSQSTSVEDDVQKLVQTLSFIGDTLSDVSQGIEDASSITEFRVLVKNLKEVAYDIEDFLDLAATKDLEHKTQGGWIVDKSTSLPSSNFGSQLKLLLYRLDELVEKMLLEQKTSDRRDGVGRGGGRAAKFFYRTEKNFGGVRQPPPSPPRFTMQDPLWNSLEWGVGGPPPLAPNLSSLFDVQGKNLARMGGRPPTLAPCLPPPFAKSKQKAGVLPTFLFYSTTETDSCYNQILASEGIIVGRAEEKEQIIQFMLSSSTKQHPNVIMVSGPQGMGKTTLVKLAFSDSRVSSSFDLVLWAHHHPVFSTLLSNIIDAGQNRFHLQGMDREGLKRRICDFLQGRKYVLVLDDFSNRKPTDWKELRELLEAGSAGSTVILITCSKQELPEIQSVKHFELKGIPENECWSLFKRFAAFDEEAEQMDPLLEQIGRSIVKNCYGSPQVIKTLASLLLTNRDRDIWEQIGENEYRSYWEVSTALLKQVPSRLIQCYAAASILAQGSVMSRDQLIYFWMAQGLLQSTKENEELRDIGNRTCNELLLGNFLQLSQRGHPIHQCSLLPCFPLRSPNTKLGGLLGSSQSKSRYLVWYAACDDEDEISRFKPSIKEKPLVVHYYVSKSLPGWLFSDMRCLRVLLLKNSQFEMLPASIDELKLLRYLSLTENHKIEALPDSICWLVNLQTLELSGCIKLKKVPRQVHKLVSLRHLLLSVQLTGLPKQVISCNFLRLLKICNCSYLKSLPQGIGNLTALRTLQVDDCLSISSLPNSIKRLTGLKELSIVNCPNLDLTGWEGLLDLRSLKFLQFQGLGKLLEFPSELQSAADSLQHLVISDCENLRTLPESLGHCTSLLELIIESSPRLLSLPQGTHALRNLLVLRISHCPELVRRCERDIGNDWHLISHIPIIYLHHKVILNRAKSACQEHPGAQRFCPSEDQSVSSISEIKPATDLFPSELQLRPPQPVVAELHSLPGPSGIRPPPSMSDYQSPHLMQQLHVPSPSTSPPPPASTGLLHHLGGSSSKRESLPEEILFLFSNGYEFEREMLIQLWMAGGFIKNEPMEINGASYFEKLVSEGYILCSGSNSLYRVNNGKAGIIDKPNYLILETGIQKDAVSADPLHVSVACDDIDETVFKTLGRFNRLRTLLFLVKNGSRLQQIPRHLFLRYESLVALDLSGTQIEELPSSAMKMISLRYLDLSWTLIELLPERIDHFRCLQTLKVKGCSRLLRLPKYLKRLIELRHLDLDVIGQLAAMPEGMGALTRLRTLSAFLVGTEEGSKIRELKHLNNLTGDFCIAKLENVQSADEAQEASLRDKRSLKKLELRWSDCQLPDSNNKDENVLEKLCPCSDLEEIQILCYRGISLPNWVADLSFHKLTSITLFKCEHVSMLPSLEKLPSLESLELISMNSVEKMDCRGEAEHVAFPKLQKLAVDEMLILESWTEAEEGDYPCLVELIIKDCPKLPELPSLPYLSSIKHLEVTGCAKLAFGREKELSRSLQQLMVEDCPLIKERCSEGGQDWQKIQHVPSIWIDQEAIQTDEDDSDGLIEDDESHWEGVFE